MQRRGGKGSWGKQRRTSGPRANNRPTRGMSIGSLQEQVATLTRELKEAREQQSATGDVLRVISGSPGELQPVFESILANATRICEAKFGTLYLREADGLRTVATHNAPTSYVQDRKRKLVRPP